MIEESKSRWNPWVLVATLPVAAVPFLRDPAAAIAGLTAFGPAMLSICGVVAATAVAAFGVAFVLNRRKAAR